MSDKNHIDASHPMNTDPEALKASLALLDDEEREEGEAATSAAVGDDAGGAGGEEGGAAGGEDEPAATAAEGDGAGAGAGAQAGSEQSGGDDEKPVSRAQFNGVLKELRETREEVKAYKAQQVAATVAAPDARDFAKEKAELREKWDSGEIESDEYYEQRDALVVEEARHAAVVQFHSLQQASQKQAVEQEWNSAITAWQTANADFLANPLRQQAVAQLIDSLGNDPNSPLSNEELIAKVQEMAFDAFNWKRELAAPAATTASPRTVAAAQAAAAASATPPLPGRGAGSNLIASQVNLADVKPGEFNKLPAHVQKELLGDED